MNAALEMEAQWAGFVRSFEAGRLAHAYVVVGSPRGGAQAFAESVLRLLFEVTSPDDAVNKRLEQHSHADVVWIEPQSKSRAITVDEIRVLNQRIRQTASEGGWKVGILRYADRLNEQAANAFLKTLEEPSGQTLLLLLTDTPHALMPTIRSRCQQIVLSGARDEGLPPEWREAVLSILRTQGARDPMQVLTMSEGLRDVLDAMKKAIEKEAEKGEDEDDKVFDARVQARVLEWRMGVLTLLLQWQRDLLLDVLAVEDDAVYHFRDEVEARTRQAKGLPFAVARRRIEEVEGMARRLSRNLPPLLVFDAGLSAPLLAKR